MPPSLQWINAYRAKITSRTWEDASRTALIMTLFTGVAVYTSISISELSALSPSSTGSIVYDFLHNGLLWMAITAVLVATPILGKTASKSLERTLGTLVGGCLGLIAVLTHSPVAIIILACFTGFLGELVAALFALEQTGKLLCVTFILASYPLFPHLAEEPDSAAALLAIERMFAIVGAILLVFILSIVWFPHSASSDAFTHTTQMIRSIQNLAQVALEPTCVHLSSPSEETVSVFPSVAVNPSITEATIAVSPSSVETTQLKRTSTPSTETLIEMPDASESELGKSEVSSCQETIAFGGSRCELRRQHLSDCFNALFAVSLARAKIESDLEMVKSEFNVGRFPFSLCSKRRPMSVLPSVIVGGPGRLYPHRELSSVCQALRRLVISISMVGNAAAGGFPDYFVASVQQHYGLHCSNATGVPIAPSLEQSDSNPSTSEIRDTDRPTWAIDRIREVVFNAMEELVEAIHLAEHLQKGLRYGEQALHAKQQHQWTKLHLMRVELMSLIEQRMEHHVVVLDLVRELESIRQKSPKEADSELVELTKRIQFSPLLMKSDIPPMLSSSTHESAEVWVRYESMLYGLVDMLKAMQNAAHAVDDLIQAIYCG